MQSMFAGNTGNYGFFLYIAFSIIHLSIIFLLGPDLLRQSLISNKQFDVLGILFSMIFLLHWIKLIAQNKNKIHTISRQNDHEYSKIILDDIAGSYKHEILPFYISWAGIVETRRLVLIIWSLLILLMMKF